MIDQNPTKRLIVIAGPTASGKSSLAIDLAQLMNCEIFSADSRQIYKEMTIGTAKPSIDELKLIPHHFINHISIHEPYSAGQYERECIAKLKDYFFNNSVGILVGGTGLYIQAVLNGLDTFPRIDPSTITQLESELAENGLSGLQKELQVVDPASYQDIDIQNSRRIIRALSVIRSSGRPFSEFKNHGNKKRAFSSINIYLNPDKVLNKSRIDQRIDLMLQMGLLEEVKALLPHKDLKALATVGYSEIFNYLNGECTLENAIEKIRVNTKRYAKRQRTWFKKRYDAELESDDKEEIKRFILKKMNDW